MQLVRLCILDAGRRQLADLNAKYEAAKNAEAEARRAYLAALPV